LNLRAQAGAAALAAALAPAPFFVSASFAQSAPLLIERGRIDRPEQQQAPTPEPPPLRGRFTLDGQTEAAPPAPPPSPPQQQQQEEQPAPLARVVVQGSSLPVEDVSETWVGKIGAPLDRSLVEQIIAALNATYQKSDIALFTILAPNQNLADGVLVLHAIEGHVAHIDIRTDHRDAKDIEYASRLAQNLTEERPLRRQTLERYLSLIRDIPGEKITARLEPAPELGGANLILEARRNGFDGGIGVDNRGTPELGRTQISFDAAYNGLLRGGDMTSFLFVMPAEDDLFTFIALGHSTPIGDDGARLNLNASQLKTQPDGRQDGEANAGGVSFSYPLIRGYKENVSLSLGIDALNSENALLGQTIANNRTRALRLGVSYAYATPQTAFGAAASLSEGFDIWGAKTDPLFADSEFTKLTGQANWSRLWARRYIARLRAQAQLSDHILPSSEQMSLGGEAYGRAYESAIVQGDQGVAAAAEGALILDAFTPSWMDGSEFYVFADAGQVWLNARPILPELDFSLSTAGLGARFALGKKTVLGLEFARSLEPPYPGAEEDWRLVYRLSTRS
jgi:hemolysin activation/secretion protein